jgi:hypothetical protein
MSRMAHQFATRALRNVPIQRRLGRILKLIAVQQIELVYRKKYSGVLKNPFRGSDLEEELALLRSMIEPDHIHNSTEPFFVIYEIIKRASQGHFYAWKLLARLSESKSIKINPILDWIEILLAQSGDQIKQRARQIYVEVEKEWQTLYGLNQSRPLPTIPSPDGKSTGGLMLWLKNMWFRGRNPTLEESHRYNSKIAPWLENTLVLTASAMVIGIPLYMLTGDWQFAIRWTNAAAWLLFFMGGHVADFFVGKRGRAPPRKQIWSNLKIAGIIALAGTMAGFLPLSTSYLLLSIVVFPLGTHIVANSKKDESMRQGAVWLASIMVALMKKDLVQLWTTNSLYVGEMETPQFDTEAKLIGQLNVWAQDPQFHDLLRQALVENGWKPESEIPMNLLSALISVLGINQTSIHQAIAYEKTGDNRLMLFKDELPPAPILMIALLKLGAENPLTILVNSPLMDKNIQTILGTMKSYGVNTALVRLKRYDPERLIQNNSIDPKDLENTYGNQSLFILPRGIELTSSRTSLVFDDLIPVSALGIQNLINALRLALTAA